MNTPETQPGGSLELVGSSIPDWAAEEIRKTWRAALLAGGQMEAYRIIERMVDRLGYGRTENNPSLCPPDEKG